MDGVKAGAIHAPELKFQLIDETLLFSDDSLEGYASLFDTPDDSGDVIAPGAFSASLAKRRRGVKLLWQHDATQPIGVWDEIAEDSRGLKVRGRLLTSLRRGAEAATLLREGAVDGLSIGYRTIASERLKNGGRRLTEIDLWEVSLVTFPMLSEARASTHALKASPLSESHALADALNEVRKSFHR